MISREGYIAHLMMMHKKDPGYAKSALEQYVEWLPHMDLNAGIRDARRAAK